MKGLTELAELLLEKEVIFSEDLERIFGKRKADILKEERESAVKNELALKLGKENVAAIGPVVTQIRESVIDSAIEKKTSGKEKETPENSDKKVKGEKAKSKK